MLCFIGPALMDEAGSAIGPKTPPQGSGLIVQGDLTRALAHDDVMRLGRSCLQDAQPMRLGQALGGYSAAVRRLTGQLEERARELSFLPLGGTAIGTGLGAAAGYREGVYSHLCRITGRDLRPAGNLFDAMQNADAFARCSAEVRIAAELLARIAGDLILLSSGPAGGIGEVLLPKVQPGSSMMPGKVNPVLPMMMQQAAFAVAGNDLSVSMAAAHGQLEINPFEPLIALRLLDSVDLLTRASRVFADHCLSGLDADRERSLADLLDSAAMATLLLPALGYAETSRLVQKAAQEGRRLVDLATEGGWIDPGALGQILSASTELR